MTNTTTELTPKGRKTFAQIHLENDWKRINKLIRKAISETRPEDPYVALIITGDGDMTRMVSSGWELVGPITSMYNAGKRYSMRMERAKLGLK